MDDLHELTGKIIGCAMTVHRTLGPGFLESVYQNALLHELAKAGVRAEQKQELQVRYDGIVVGTFETDVLVESTVLLELKSVERLAKIHGVQLVNYLTATELDVGLLINFGGESLEFKRKYRLRKPNPENPVNPVQKNAPSSAEESSVPDSAETLYDRLKAVDRIIKDLPSDFAENHDHYIHGRPNK